MKVLIGIDNADPKCTPFKSGEKRIEIENLRLIMTNEQFEIFCRGIARAWKEWTGEGL